MVDGLRIRVWKDRRSDLHGRWRWAVGDYLGCARTRAGAVIKARRTKRRVEAAR